MSATEICGLIDNDLVTFIHNMIVLVKLAVPIVLIILGMIDFGKGVAASSEDELKKGQQVFIKRLIAGVVVFLMITIAQFTMSIVSKDDSSIWACASQILNGIPGSPNIDNVSCNFFDKSISSEYEYCLSKASSDICNSIFQNVCSGSENLLWNYDSTYTNETGKALISDYSCSGYASSTNFFYEQSLYSCTTDYNDMSITECANTLNMFCKKKSNVVTSDSIVSCVSSKYYDEFQHCLTLTPNLSSPHEVCATYFQEVCSSQLSSPIWSTNSSYLKSKLPNVTCALSDGSESEVLKKQLYSCAMENINVPFEDAVSICLSSTPAFKNYCHM